MLKAIQVIAFLSVFFLVSCSSENNRSENNGKKNLSDYSLVDSKDKKLKINLAVSNLIPDGSKTTSSKRAQPINNSDNLFEKFDIENVFLDVQSIEAHTEEDGWIVLDNRTQRIDLLELQNGVASMLFNDVMPVGSYTQIRLMLGEKSEIHVAGYPYHLEIPSGEQTGVKLVSSFEIQEGKVVEIKLKIDLASTLGYVFGKGFSMKPTIKIEGVQEVDAGGKVKAEGGSVSTEDGKVTLSIPENALQNEVLITVEELNATEVGGEYTENLEPIGTVYEFGPDGQTFEEPVIVAMAYDETEVKKLGLEKNLVVLYLNEATNKWEKIPRFVSEQNNIVYAKIEHFSKYLLASKPTCNDGLQNQDEAGIDCGGVCGNECFNCLVPENEIGQDSIWETTYYSDEFQPVVDEALREYATLKNITVDAIDTADEKLEAANYYVYKYMAYMLDDSASGEEWFGLQKPVKTVLHSGQRKGYPDESAQAKQDCNQTYTHYRGENNERITGRYCGDCEDFAIFRAALARNMGVAASCIYNADYYAELTQPYDPSEDNSTIADSNTEDNTTADEWYWTTDGNCPNPGGCTDTSSGGAADDVHDYWHATDAEGRIIPGGSSWLSDRTGVSVKTDGTSVTVDITWERDGDSTATSVPADTAPQDDSESFTVPTENIPESDPLSGFFQGTNEGGHSFNVVVYQNRYRLMDYHPLKTYFSSDNNFSRYNHRVSNVWNDKEGRYWAIPWSDQWGNPGKKIQNYKNGEKCFETGKNHWSSKTLYKDICD